MRTSWRAVIIVLVFAVSGRAEASSCAASQLSSEAISRLKPLLLLYEKQANEVSRLGISPERSSQADAIDKRLLAAVQDRSPPGDEVLVYLLGYYIGEGPGHWTFCEAVKRGEALRPLIEKYNRCFPNEPSSKVLARGTLLKRALSDTERRSICPAAKVSSNNAFERTFNQRGPRLAAVRSSWPAAQLGR